MQIKPSETTILTNHLPNILWKRGALWLLFLGALFFIAYNYANGYTSTRTDVGVMVADWERSLPFVPWLMLPYMSIDLFYAASLFVFRKRKQLDRHALRLLLATVISLLGFLIFPLRFSFAVPKAEGFNGLLQAALLTFDKHYNQAPSLHISLLIVLWVMYAKKLYGWAKLVMHAWFLAIGASVLLVYQHHFIDVWTGALVGLACLYLIPDAPFAWRWQPPSARSKGLAKRYGFGAVFLLIFGLLASQVCVWLAAFLLWGATSLSLVAMAYFGFEQLVFQRHRGQMRWPAKLLLVPYLLGNWLSYRRYTYGGTLPIQVHDKIWLGAFPRNEVNMLGVIWFGVLNMTHEFGVAPIAASRRKYLPVLDLTPPKSAIIVRAVRWLEQAQLSGNVLVHCALGVSRSASVVICWLIWRGLAADITQAAAMLHRAGNSVVLSAEHRQNIENALKSLGKHG